MKYLLITCLIFGLMGCSKPSLQFEATEVAGALTFEVNTNSKVNGLLGCLVWVEGASGVLWDARLDYFSRQSFKYGAQTKGFRQKHPIRGAASAPPKDVKIYVLIEFQYDSAFSASGGSRLYAFTHHSDGTIENLGEQEWVKPPNIDWSDARHKRAGEEL